MSVESKPELSERLTFAIETARGAGEVAMRWFQSDELVTTGKADGSPVTQADQAAERFVRDAIGRAYPEDGIVGEEYDATESRSGRTWVIDPIDGTKSFVHGVPLFGTLLACLDNGVPRIGVIVMPALHECVAAEVGAGCWWWRGDRGPVRAGVSEHATLDGAMLLSTSFQYYDTHERKLAWVGMNGRGAHTRGWSDCYAFVLLATGRAEGVVEPALMNLWDIACVPVIVGEAGGDWSDIHGRKDLRSGSMVASNGRLHGEILEAMGCV
jgi:histidinol-phosphatase